MLASGFGHLLLRGFGGGLLLLDGAVGFGFLQDDMQREFDAELFTANFAEQLFVVGFCQLFLGHFVGRSKFDDEFAVFSA